MSALISCQKHPGQYMLILSADANKNIVETGVMRMQTSTDGKSFDANLSVTQTNSLTAVNIAPLNVTVDGTTKKFSMTVFAYAPVGSTNMVTAKDKQSLVDYVLKKVQPVLKAAR